MVIEYDSNPGPLYDWALAGWFSEVNARRITPAITLDRLF